MAAAIVAPARTLKSAIQLLGAPRQLHRFARVIFAVAAILRAGRRDRSNGATASEAPNPLIFLGIDMALFPLKRCRFVSAPKSPLTFARCFLNGSRRKTAALPPFAMTAT